MLLTDAQYSRKRIERMAKSNLSYNKYDYYYEFYSTYIIYLGVPITAWTNHSTLYTIKVVRGDTNELLAKKTSCSPFEKEDFISFFVSVVGEERKKNLIRRKGDYHENNTREEKRWLCFEEHIGTYRDDNVVHKQSS